MIDDLDLISGVGAVAQADGDPGPGVQVVSTGLISDALQLAVANVLARVPPDKHAALVGILTRRGMNLAFAVKITDTFQVATWVGKSGWDQVLGGGVAVQKVW